MKIITTEIPDVLIIEPKVFEDERGFFFESFNQKQFDEAVGYPVNFVQDNHSKSVKGVLRGLHYQEEPYAQGKLVRCVVGEVFDVAVDIRKNSPTFGKWVGVNLSAENKRQLWIPEGAEFNYKTTNYYKPQFEKSIHWMDKTLAINWPVSSPKLSEKDIIAPFLSNIEPYKAIIE